MTTRRDVIVKLLPGAVAAAALTVIAPRRAVAAERLTIFSHAVHKGVSTTGPGGDVTAAWRAKNGAEVEWLTSGVEATNERAFKEASLGQGGANIVFLLDRYTGPQFAGLFEDLSAWQAKDPIPGLNEIPAGMVGAHTFGGKLSAVPFRHATHGLHYNTTFLTERGVQPPKTIEQTLKAAEQLTYTRADGTRVYGLIINFDDPSSPIDWIRAFGGDFITPTYDVVIDQPAAVRGVAAICDLYKREILPKNVLTMKTEDVTTFMQQGRAAMCNQPFGRFGPFNDPKASKFPGQIAVAPLPLGSDGKPMPAKTSVWAMAIPRNSRNKELSWSLIKHLSLAESVIAEALNGNGPVRPSAYDDAKVKALIPYAAAEKQALASARLVVPGFPNNAKAMDIFIEEFSNAMLGTKEPQVAMADLKKRVVPLMPAK